MFRVEKKWADFLRGGGKEDRAKKEEIRNRASCNRVKRWEQNTLVVPHNMTHHDQPPRKECGSDEHLHLQVWQPLRLPIDRRQLNVRLEIGVERTQ